MVDVAKYHSTNLGREGKGAKMHSAFMEQGLLENQTLIELLYVAAKGKKTGFLRLEEDGQKIDLFFRGGQLAGVRSNYIPGLDLPEILYHSGKISEQHYRQAKMRMLSGGSRIGDFLLTTGIMNEDDLRRALIRQMRAKYFRAFEFRHGTYHFITQAVIPHQALSIDFLKATLKAIETKLEPAYLLRIIRKLRLQSYLHVSLLKKHLPKNLLSPREVDFILCLSQGERLGIAAEKYHLSLKRGYILIVYLFALGFIELHDRSVTNGLSSVSEVDLFSHRHLLRDQAEARLQIRYDDQTYSLALPSRDEQNSKKAGHDFGRPF
jgi:hypothetical protein